MATTHLAERVDELILLFLEKLEAGWIDGRQIVDIADRVGIRELSQRILFVTELSKIAASIPEKAHGDPAKMNQLRGAIQEALDDLIEQEESEEEDG